MNRRHLRTAATIYLVISLMTGLTVFGYRAELIAFMVLSILVGGLILVAANSHFQWKEAKRRRREARDVRIRRSASRPEPKQFGDRLAHFTGRDIPSNDPATEPFHSNMRLWCAADLKRTSPVGPKSPAYLRRILLLIRSILSGSH